MPKSPNSFQKRSREIEKKRKAEEKLKRRRTKKENTNTASHLTPKQES
jgi:hypothetical protein